MSHFVITRSKHYVVSLVFLYVLVVPLKTIRFIFKVNNDAIAFLDMLDFSHYKKFFQDCW